MTAEEIMIKYLSKKENKQEVIMQLEKNMQDVLDRILKRFPNMDELLDQEQEELMEYFGEVSYKTALQKDFIERIIDNPTDTLLLMVDYHEHNKNIVNGIVDDYEEVIVLMLYLQVAVALERSKMVREVMDMLNFIQNDNNEDENVN